MPVWLIWVILAGGFAAGETMSGALVLAMMSGGALGGALTALITSSLAAQIVVAVIVTIGLIWLVRPVAIRHMNPPRPAVTGSDALVGQEAVVLRTVTRDGGLVRLNGAEWTARARDPQQALTAGTRVSVVEIDGATAVVWKDPFD